MQILAIDIIIEHDGKSFLEILKEKTSEYQGKDYTVEIQYSTCYDSNYYDGDGTIFSALIIARSKDV